MAVGRLGPETCDAVPRSAAEVADTFEASSPSELKPPTPVDRMRCQQVFPKMLKIGQPIYIQDIHIYIHILYLATFTCVYLSTSIRPNTWHATV